MDLLMVVIIFVAGLFTIGVAAYMLNRAWGDFPSQITLPPEVFSSSAPSRRSEATPGAWEEQEDEEESTQTFSDHVPVTHPVMRRAISDALDRGGSPFATYFIRNGDAIFFVPERVPDPEQREQLRQIFQGLHSGDLSSVPMSALTRLLGQLSRR